MSNVPAEIANLPQIAAIILAAGKSLRMGRNKLLVEIDGESLVRHVAGKVVSSHARPVIVVTGNEANRVERALAGSGVTTIRNPDFHAGLSSSIRAGVGALPQTAKGVLIALGDMPGISPRLFDRMIERFASENENVICVATRNGVQGNPVLFGRRFFLDLLALSGEFGAKRLLAENRQSVREIEADDDGPLIDIDTPAALAAWLARAG